MDTLVVGLDSLNQVPLRGRFTRRLPSPKSQFTRGQSVQSQPLRAWMLGFAISHGSQVVSPKYDMDVYMALLLKVGLGGLC